MLKHITAKSALIFRGFFQDYERLSLPHVYSAPIPSKKACRLFRKHIRIFGQWFSVPLRFRLKSWRCYALQFGTWYYPLAASMFPTLKMEAVGSSETLISRYQIARRHTPEDRGLFCSFMLHNPVQLRKKLNINKIMFLETSGIHWLCLTQPTHGDLQFLAILSTRTVQRNAWPAIPTLLPT
jgi:hypothetical protein